MKLLRKHLELRTWTALVAIGVSWSAWPARAVDQEKPPEGGKPVKQRVKSAGRKFKAGFKEAGGVVKDKAHDVRDGFRTIFKGKRHKEAED